MPQLHLLLALEEQEKLHESQKSSWIPTSAQYASHYIRHLDSKNICTLSLLILIASAKLIAGDAAGLAGGPGVFGGPGAGGAGAEPSPSLTFFNLPKPAP